MKLKGMLQLNEFCNYGETICFKRCKGFSKMTPQEQLLHFEIEDKHKKMSVIQNF